MNNICSVLADILHNVRWDSSLNQESEPDLTIQNLMNVSQLPVEFCKRGCDAETDNITGWRVTYFYFTLHY